MVRELDHSLGALINSIIATAADSIHVYTTEKMFCPVKIILTVVLLHQEPSEKIDCMHFIITVAMHACSHAAHKYSDTIY